MGLFTISLTLVTHLDLAFAAFVGTQIAGIELVGTEMVAPKWCCTELVGTEMVAPKWWHRNGGTEMTLSRSYYYHFWS